MIKSSDIRKKGLLSAAFAVFAAALLLASTAYSLDAPMVMDIEFQGLRRVDVSVVKNKISHFVGKPFVYERVSDDIKAIFGTGYFEDVRVLVEPLEGGVRIIYKVRESPTIRSIDFQGNEKIKEDKLREQLTLTPGSVADTVAIQRSVDTFLSQYQMKGYMLARVVPVLRKLSDESVLLTYQVQEGQKAKVRKIHIKGNSEIQDSKIKDVMKTSVHGMFSFFKTGGGRYAGRQVMDDIEKIRGLYLDHGFMDAVVSGPELVISEDKKHLELTLFVSEGKQYQLSSLSIAGNTVFTEDELLSALNSKPGDPLGRSKLRADTETITQMYMEQGYALVNIHPEILPDTEKAEVALRLKITEGDVFKVGKVEVTGNIKTRDKVIRREMLLDEGDVFNSKLLKRSHQRVTNLNLFESVSFDPVPNRVRKSLDIGVDVQERSTGLLSIGGGYSSIDHFIGMVDFTQGNLWGKGHFLKLKGEFGGKSTTYEVSYRNPWFLDRPISSSVSIYDKQRQYIDYDKESTGFTMGLGRRFLDYWRVGFSYNYEKATITGISNTASAIIVDQAGTRTTSSITPSISRDSRDNFLNTHSGSRHSLYLTYAGIGGDNKFIKGVLDTVWFFPVTTRTTFSLRTRFGQTTGLDGEKLPLYERFYIGGIHTVRGLGFGEGGPKDLNNEPIGGENQIIMNAEYVFPLVSAAKLKGVFFVDAGAAYDTSSDLKLRYSTGTGIRWLSPVGPLRFEWGYNLDRQPGESSSRFEFTFGSFF